MGFEALNGIILILVMVLAMSTPKSLRELSAVQRETNEKLDKLLKEISEVRLALAGSTVDDKAS